MKLKLALLVLVVGARVFAAGPLEDKTPAYFVDRYGPATESRMEMSASFFIRKRGAAKVDGSFSVREFRHNDLRVTAVFFHPSLKLASVRLQLKHAWTAEQVAAALEAYGASWKPTDGGIDIKEWIAPDGTQAIKMLTWVDFQSAEAVALANKALAEADAKRKANPKL